MPIRRGLRWLGAPSRRGVVAAVAVAAGLRLAWVLWATRTPSLAVTDTSQFLSMAQQFADGETYRLNGHVSGFYPPGWPFLLAPVAWLSAHTGWFSLPFGAAVVNVVAGTTTVVLGALLAHRWFGGRAAVVAAWLLALAPGPIFLTSTALSETVFTALVLGALVLVTEIVLGRDPPTTARLVGLGLLLGYTALVRSPGALVLLVAAVALRRRTGSWRTAGRPLLTLALAALVVLVPWTVRNGVQVGVWTPTSTNNAAFLCLGHRDHAVLDTTQATEEDFRPCFEGTPFAPNPDEGAWYAPTVREAASWAVHHPVEEIGLSWAKTYRLFADDQQALGDAQDFGEQRFLGIDAAHRLSRVNDLWHWSVLALGLAGLALLAPVRRAWPLWSTAVGLTVAVWGGVPLDRFHHTVMAVLAVFASATLLTMGRWASAGVGIATGSDADVEVDEDEPPPPPAEGMARAARTGSRWSGPMDHPFAPLFLAVATGAWASTIVFDAISIPADSAFVYARGAWLLTGIGVAAGLASAGAFLLDLVSVPRGTVAFRLGVRHLIALDVALVAFTASFLVRHDSDFRYHDASPTLAIALSIVGLLALAVTLWWGGTLTYRYGLRVATDDVRQEGFEPADR